MDFPATRLRRLRRSTGLRRLLSEQRLHPEQLVQTLCLVPGESYKRPIANLPGVFELSVDHAASAARAAEAAGLAAVYLIGSVSRRDREGSGAWSAQGVLQKAIETLKDSVPELCVIAELDLSSYTDHGHPGVQVDDELDNDETLERLSRAAVSLARSGADVIAPGGMIDGMVLALRETLDEDDHEQVALMSTSVAFASEYDHPLRAHFGPSPEPEERAAYELGTANAREAAREAALDLAEGADMMMMRPALAYLDILSELRESFELPLAAFSSSGELTMVEAAAQMGWVDRRRMILENLISIRRAGADFIVTPWATEVAGWLNERRNIEDE